MKKLAYLGSRSDILPLIVLPKITEFVYVDLWKPTTDQWRIFEYVLSLIGFYPASSQSSTNMTFRYYVNRATNRHLYCFFGVDLEGNRFSAKLKQHLAGADTLCTFGTALPTKTWILLPNIRHVILDNGNAALLHPSGGNPDMYYLLYVNHITNIDFYVVDQTVTENVANYDLKGLMEDAGTDDLTKVKIPRGTLIGPFALIQEAHFYSIRKDRGYSPYYERTKRYPSNMVLPSISSIPKKAIENF